MARLSPLSRVSERSSRMLSAPSALGTTLLRCRATRMAVMEYPMRAWLKGGVVALLFWAQGALADTVLVVGDSISAAFGLETSQGWVQLLQQRLDGEGGEHRVVNASISGDTTAGGLSRLPGLLAEHRPDVVVIELGGNDGLRGLSPVQMKQNLAAMIDRSHEAGARVLLLGMRMRRISASATCRPSRRYSIRWPRKRTWLRALLSRGCWRRAGDDAERPRAPHRRSPATPAGQRLGAAGSLALSPAGGYCRAP